MKYNVQHNGKGKYHLIDDEFDSLCGAENLDFSSRENLIIESDTFYILNTVFETNTKQRVSKDLILVEYCQKCISKASKIENERIKNKYFKTIKMVVITKIDMLAYIKFVEKEKAKNEDIVYTLKDDICIKKDCLTMDLWDNPSGKPEFFRTNQDVTLFKGDILEYCPVKQFHLVRQKKGLKCYTRNIPYNEILLFAYINSTI